MYVRKSNLFLLPPITNLGIHYISLLMVSRCYFILFMLQMFQSYVSGFQELDNWS